MVSEDTPAEPESAAHTLSIAARITTKRMVTPDACRFELRAADGGALPRFTPGAHINVRTPRGDVRSYSLTDEPADGDHYAITVHRNSAGRGGSVSLVDDTAVGDLVQISEPANAFPLRDAPSYLLIAGGIGITPIRSMFRALRRAGDSDVKLLYITRSLGRTAYLDEFASPDLVGQVALHHSDRSGPIDLWPYLASPGDTHLYVCGPAPLLDRILALTMHWRPSAVHFEQFSGVSALGATSTAFQARWKSTGEVIDVPPTVTLLEALESRGKAIPNSCRSGTCGTCRIRLFSGAVDHRDLVLTAEDREHAIMPCVSRAAGADLITVDLE